jgi:hypothetical protein
VIWLLIIPLIVLWAILQKNIVETTGRGPQSRSSLRRQRRAARKLGIDPAALDYQYRSEPVEYDEIKAKVDRLGWMTLPFTLLVLGYFVGALMGWWN